MSGNIGKRVSAPEACGRELLAEGHGLAGLQRGGQEGHGLAGLQRGGQEGLGPGQGHPHSLRVRLVQFTKPPDEPMGITLRYTKTYVRAHTRQLKCVRAHASAREWSFA